MTHTIRNLIWSLPVLSASLNIASAATTTAESARLEREIITHRTSQAVYWGMPAVALVVLRRGAERDLGRRISTNVNSTRLQTDPAHFSALKLLVPLVNQYRSVRLRTLNESDK